MSIFTRELFASAASSAHGLTVGTVAEPVRLSWREVHEQAKQMAGSLAATGIGRRGSVAVLAADAADVALDCRGVIRIMASRMIPIELIST